MFLVADTHCDLLCGRLAGYKNAEDFDVSYEKLRRGNVGLQVFAAFVNSARAKENTVAAYEAQLADFPTMVADLGLTACVDIPAELSADKILAVSSIEGCEAFGGSLEKIDEFAARGVRMAAVIWNNENELAFPNGTTGGLKDFGKKVLARMREKKIAVDVSHLNQKGFWQAADITGTLLASHSCCMSLCSHKRNLCDEQIKALIEMNGFVGINFNPPFLVNDGKAAIADIVAHVHHILDMGGQDIVGLGSDFDGIGSKPVGAEDSSTFPAILEALSASGIDNATLEKIANKNFLRFMASL